MKTKIINKYNYPNLPVPNSDETLLKFLNWVQPIVSETDFTEAQQLVKEYLNSDADKKIQAHLNQKATDKNNSWLAQWWMDIGYLSSRGPVAPECNAPMIFSHPATEKYTVAQMMSLFAFDFSSQYLDYKTNGIPDYQPVPNPKVKMSLDQVCGMFASFREPNKNMDNYYICENTSKHIIVVKNNITYKVPVIENNQVIDLNIIHANIKNIVENETTSADVNFNFITSSINRDNAKDVLDDLLTNPINKASYQEVKDAIIVLTYDENNITDDAKLFKNSLASPCFNRWHGKSLMFIFNKNKKTIFLGDHTFMDGGSEVTLIFRFLELLNKEPQFKDVQSKNYEALNFELTDNQKTTLKNIFKQYQQYIDNSKLVVNNMTNINSKLLKEKGIKSVDGFVHILFQIAQYKTNKQLRNTYVAVDTRNFFRGRTECIRPINMYSKELTIKYCEKSFKNNDELFELMNKSFDEHYLRAKDCKKGHGINRHMLGMSLAYNDLKNEIGSMPKLFECNAWKIISGNPISTSSIVTPILDNFYFDPVHPDGIGIGYTMLPFKFGYTVSGWSKDAAYHSAFCKNLEDTVNEFVDILQLK